ncbi:hyalin-like [Strongylocentrotus purpuratus]|uniref:HYR domain-containing protein n=1 Tax=Strongylocentrotus purpuratus TaxID=7668 RepID=A0A7M7NRI9_STRPU|nr:hyalin-like [Strongylocentrotus purpuratus]|eukprot:XP_011664564.1 PREDICTED: hyalin-like isoform X2 [Strongylocentrotus purpuratus]
MQIKEKAATLPPQRSRFVPVMSSSRLRLVPAVPRPPGTSLQYDASQPITAVSNFSPGDSFDVSTYLVIYYLIDNASFYSTCSFEVTVTSSGVVINRENPILTGCPTDIVANTSPGTSTPVVSWLAPVASDNFDSVSLTVN